MLTLSFAGNTLRLLTTRGSEVTLWHSLVFNPALLRRGVVAGPEEMARVITNALRARGVSDQGHVSVALSGQGAISRILSIPPDRRARPADIIPREARRSMGVSPDETHIFWEPLRGADRRQFFVVAVPRETIRQLVQTLKLAGLRPAAFDLAPIALARAANLPHAVAASIDAGLLEVAIIVDSEPVLVRTELISEGGLATGEGIAGAAATSIGRTISFYNDSHREKPLTADIPLVLGGGQAENTDLLDRIARDLGHPLRQPSLPMSFPDGFTPAPFLVNLGLALREL